MCANELQQWGIWCCVWCGQIEQLSMNSGQSLGVEPVWLALVAYHPQSWSFVTPSLSQHEILGSTLLLNLLSSETNLKWSAHLQKKGSGWMSWLSLWNTPTYGCCACLVVQPLVPDMSGQAVPLSVINWIRQEVLWWKCVVPSALWWLCKQWAVLWDNICL